MKMITIMTALALALTSGIYGQDTAPVPDKPFVEMEQAQRILKETGVTGGLVVHVGCGENPSLTLALRASDAFVVQGLETDPEKVSKVRKVVRDAGAYGPVSVAPWSGGALPYVDNLVNLIVVSGEESPVSPDEYLRALAPGGAAVFINPQSQIENRKWVKPWPAENDEWSHYLRDASGNPVGTDETFGPSRHIQWMDAPMYTRFHDKMSGLSAMVSDHGRVFHIMDEQIPALVGLDPKWRLTARDAFNGLVLWQKEIASWQDWMTPFKSGPATLPRRLVATGDQVFVTLGIGEPVSVLEAATGTALGTLDPSAFTEEILVADGVAICAGNANRSSLKKGRFFWEMEPWFLRAFRVSDRSKLWEAESVVYPLSLTVVDRTLFFFDGESVVARNLLTGESLWRSDRLDADSKPPSWHGATLVVADGIVLFSGGTKKSSTLFALDARTGARLWDCVNPDSGHYTPKDVLVVRGVVYVGDTNSGNGKGYYGYDLHSGRPMRNLLTNERYFHQRCYRARAAGHYILSPRDGTELVDVRDGTWQSQMWIRGACLFGVMPSYGMLYITPQPCGCFADHKLNGFATLRSSSPTVERLRATPDAERLVRGPAYAMNLESSIANPTSEDWPTYRQNNARNGSTAAAVSDEMSPAWTTALGGKLTAPTIADGKVFVAERDRHRLVAIDAGSGKVLWRFVADGRIDSPPTIYRHWAIFGCRDGAIYAVHIADGQLAWRLQVAPDLKTMAYGQLESLWPLFGSVLIRDDVLYAVAGRSMHLDGGLRLARVAPLTGEILEEHDWNADKRIDQKFPVGFTHHLTASGSLNDILSDDGERLWMRSMAFDYQGQRHPPLFELEVDARQRTGSPEQLHDLLARQAHLFAPTGFLDDQWFHRSYWTYATLFPGGAFEWYLAGQTAPSGRLLTFDDTHVYGYGRKPDYYSWTAPIEYRLYRSPRAWRIDVDEKVKNTYTGLRVRSRFLTDWEAEIPIHVRAMVKTKNRLIVAGPPQIVKEGPPKSGINGQRPIPAEQSAKAEAAWHGEQGGQLMAFSTEDDSSVWMTELNALPVFDGLAAANGCLYLSLADGKVRCFEGNMK